MLNFLLDEELLTEEQTPETAIATELKYNLVESYQVVNINKEYKYVEKQQIQSMNTQDCLNIRYNIKNDFLEKFKDHGLVFMLVSNKSLGI